MVLLPLGLGASVVYERVKAPEDCWQTSISAYYYTPVEGFFVGALVTIGICLIALKGSTEPEDITLNLAGACAPFVAFVPTPKANVCGYNITDEGARNLSVGNNVFALLFIGLVTLIFIAALTRSTSSRYAARPTALDKRGYLVAVVLFAITAVTFFFAREFFIRWGHPAAAITMFVFIVVVVRLNARDLARSQSIYRNRYGMVFAAMLGASALNVIAGVLGWKHWILSIEASLIFLFAVFWLLQTLELWNEGLRTSPGDEELVGDPGGPRSSER
jgi:hypothetical protein